MDKHANQKFYAIAARQSTNGVYFFNQLFKQLNINAEYISSPTNNLDELLGRGIPEDLNGASVAAPFKQCILKYVDIMTEVAQKANSVNCIKKVGNQILGHNTDQVGLEKMFIKNQNVFGQTPKILIYGSGGVVPSVILAIKNIVLNPIIYLSARNKNTAMAICEKHGITYIDTSETVMTDLWINATPACAQELDNILLLSQNSQSVFDLNPIQEKYPFELHVIGRRQNFLRGFEFYKEQFLAQFEFFTECKVQETAFDALASLRLGRVN